jgi:hypothetical protein
MPRLPDAGWWQSVQFATGQLPHGSPGFAMSRAEMTELFELARGMQADIYEQFAAQRAMVDIAPPSEDPASHGYLSGADGTGARAVGDAYTWWLHAQADYLQRLVAKLAEALGTVEGADAEGAGQIDRVNRTI